MTFVLPPKIIPLKKSQSCQTVTTQNPISTNETAVSGMNLDLLSEYLITTPFCLYIVNNCFPRKLTSTVYNLKYNHNRSVKKTLGMSGDRGDQIQNYYLF